MSLVLIKRVGSNVKPPLPAISTALYCRPQFTGKHSSRTQSEGRRGEGGGGDEALAAPKKKRVEEVHECVGEGYQSALGEGDYKYCMAHQGQIWVTLRSGSQ